MPLATDHFRAGGGTPLVLLHPAMTSWRAWRPVLDLLTPHHDVLAPTLPGHRGGPPPPAALTFSGWADAVESLLDRAGVGRAHLVGNSLGAVAALELARRGRALSATAIAPPGAWATRGDRLLLEAKLTVATRLAGVPLPVPDLRSARLRRAALASVMVRGDRVPAEELRHLLAGRRHAAIFVTRLIAGLREERHRIAPFAPGPCPTAVVWPRCDRVLPYRRYGRPFRQLLPHATHVALPAAGHIPMYDQPARLAETILSLTLSTAPDTTTDEAV